MQTRILLLASLMLIHVAPSRAQQTASNEQILRQAKEAYYSLKSHGLAQFSCVVQPDWDSLYKNIKTDAAGREQLLPILRSTHFRVLVGSDGASTVSHETDVAPPDEAIAQRVRQSVDGMEQILTGFFQTWSGFMVKSIFPDPDGQYQLEDQGDKYELTYGEGSVHVVIVMSHELAIESMRVAMPKLDATLRPEWSASRDGFLLKSYQASYRNGTGEPVQLSVVVEYENVEDLELPKTVDATVDLPAGPVPIRLAFMSCQAKKR